MAALDLTAQWPPPHVSAAVLVGGRQVDHRGDVDRQYRLASIAKVITAWAALVAVEEGIVTLDDPVGQPGCTLRHLLAHAGGYGFDGPDPISRPGVRRTYSNTGIDMAADHVAAAAAMPFADYLHQSVFEPLGMAASSLRGSPAAHIWSTLADLTRFTAELMRPRLITPATAAEVRTVQFPGLPGILPGVGRYDDNTWGLGAEIRSTKVPHWTGTTNSPATYGHFGGAGTLLWVDPQVDIGLAVLTDLPFDDWVDTALRCWPELADAVLAEHGGPD